MTKKKKQAKKSTRSTIVKRVRNARGATTKRIRKYLARRPHRSFRLTRQRDYKRSLELPGYWSFTNSVRKVLWANWKLFGGLALVYIVATIVISGFGAQEHYKQLADLLEETGGYLFEGSIGAVGQAGLLLLTTVTTGLSPSLTEAQSILGGLALFFAWLATIWLLRNVLAGNKPRLRDGLYNSGSPVLATIIVGFIIMVQLLPAAIALIIYSSAQVSGLLESGVSAMLVWLSVALLSLLSIYWVASSFIAMVIVTLPGMYPMQAIRTAGDLVVGRRLRMFLRLLWLAVVVVVTWAILVIPVILFDDWIKQLVPTISWLPLVPIVIVSMSALTIIFVTSYIYLLYRRIVDDDAAPA